jgi:hypothetical protein
MNATHRERRKSTFATSDVIRTIVTMRWRGSIVVVLMPCLLFCAPAVAEAATPVPASLPHRPLVITRGGTYTGEWSSNDARVPAVLVKTAEPVIIENSALSGRGNLVAGGVHHINLTVRHTRGVGANPNVSGQCAGRFITLEQFDNLVIEHCELRGTAGIYALDYAGDRTPDNSVRIVSNRAINIDGRKSDGKGGYVSGDDSAELVQFVQLDKVRHAPGIEIAWNEVTNRPFVSRVEDVISIYLSSGTRQSPIRIHDNFIRGAYPVGVVRGGVFAGHYSGGGIMLGDGVADSADGDSCFVHACANHVLDTVNYGIAVSAGHDNHAYRNRVLSAGVLESGERIAAQNVGIYVWDSYKAGKARFFNNTGSGNLVGWTNGTGRNDWWTPDAAEWKDNLPWPAASITRDAYEQEHALWAKKCAAAGVTVGSRTLPATR